MGSIRFIDVSKIYHDNEEVIKNLDLEISNGNFVSIVGPYGCGKTTILKLIAGLIPSSSGSILIKNKISAEELKNRKIGFCFQSPTLLPWLNTIENVILPQQFTSSRDKEKAFQLLKVVNLEDKAYHKIHQLSGGMQKLVSILRSLILDPDILLLDEPFSSIDEISRMELQRHLLNIHKQTHKTTILVTHSLSEAVFLSDEVVVLTNKPARVKKIIEINLSPRDQSVRTSKIFFDYVNVLMKELVNE